MNDYGFVVIQYFLLERTGGSHVIFHSLQCSSHFVKIRSTKRTLTLSTYQDRTQQIFSREHQKLQTPLLTLQGFQRTITLLSNVPTYNLHFTNNTKHMSSSTSSSSKGEEPEGSSKATIAGPDHEGGDDFVDLLVGGYPYRTTRSVLLRSPFLNGKEETYFHALLSGRWKRTKLSMIRLQMIPTVSGQSGLTHYLG